MRASRKLLGAAVLLMAAWAAVLVVGGFEPGDVGPGGRPALFVGRARAAAGAPDIDVVLLWVNGTDPVHQRALAEFGGGAPEPGAAADAATANRWRDNSELRYALRSIAQNAPWVRHVYVVTSLGQRPSFLRERHPWVTVVHDRDLFPDPSHLPTFNNHAIEAHLHRIPGLSEIFIKMDDDQLFGRPVFPEDFYQPGTGLRVHLEPSLPVSAAGAAAATNGATNGWCVALANTNELISQELGARTRDALVHVPHVLRKSTLAAISDTWPDELERCSAARLRSAHDVDVVFASHHLHLERGRSAGVSVAQLVRDESAAGLEFMVPGVFDGLDPADVRSARDVHEPEALLAAYRDYEPGMNGEPQASLYVKERTTFKFLTLTDDAAQALSDLRSVVRIRRKFVTINDDMKRGGGESQRVLQRFYDAMFPNRGGWELPPARPG